MKCVSCSSNIDANFKHAISKNECPVCGGMIMDEETLALIENIEETILSQATVRSETAKNLAMVLVAQYNISFNEKPQIIKKTEPSVEKEDVNQLEEIKIAQPSAASQLIKKKPKNENIINVSEIASAEISEEERERIMAEAVSEKMNMTNMAVFSEEDAEEFVENEDVESPEASIMSKALFGDNSNNNILEEERMMRLAKQQQAIQSGSGGFRRGS